MELPEAQLGQEVLQESRNICLVGSSPHAENRAQAHSRCCSRYLLSDQQLTRLYEHFLGCSLCSPIGKELIKKHFLEEATGSAQQRCLLRVTQGGVRHLSEFFTQSLFKCNSCIWLPSCMSVSLGRPPGIYNYWGQGSVLDP